MKFIQKFWVPVLLVGCSLGFPAQAELVHINNVELEDLLSENIMIVDVRRSEEWLETGILPGSQQSTFFDKLGRYDAKQWLDQLSLVADKKTPVILICHTGVRSRAIGQWLSSKVGYETIYNVKSGIDSWIKSGRTTVPAPIH